MVLDLDHLQAPPSPHNKTVRLAEGGVCMSTSSRSTSFCADSYFQLRLGGVIACSELIVSTL